MERAFEKCPKSKCEFANALQLWTCFNGTFHGARHSASFTDHFPDTFSLWPVVQSVTAQVVWFISMLRVKWLKTAGLALSNKIPWAAWACKYSGFISDILIPLKTAIQFVQKIRSLDRSPTVKNKQTKEIKRFSHPEETALHRDGFSSFTQGCSFGEQVTLHTVPNTGAIWLSQPADLWLSPYFGIF